MGTKSKNYKPIQYLSSLTGSGKSEHIIDKIINDSGRYLIVAPNRELCDELFLRLTVSRDNGLTPEVEAFVIHQNINDKPSKELKSIIENKTTARAIVTTSASFMIMLNKQIKVSDWNLIFDEEVGIFEEHEINVTSYTKQIIEDTIDFTESENGFYNIAMRNPLFGMNYKAGVVRDSFLNSNKAYKKLVDDIMDDKYDTLVTEESIKSFDERELDASGKKFTKFYAMSLLRMDMLYQFKSILILCSFFERTITYKLLKYMGCTLTPYPFVPDMKKHHNTDKINIHYFFKSNWSTTLRRKKIGRAKTVEDLVYDNIKALIGNNRYLYNANINFRQSIKGGTLAASTHGINKYKTYTELVFMPSFNATSATVKLLGKFGMKRKDIDFSRNVLTAYQFASRGAIRDADNTKQVNLYVMDKRTADFLKTVFKDAKVHYHDLETLVADEKAKKVNVPNNIKSFMSRVRSRLNNGEYVRPDTLEKYKAKFEEYYNG